MAAPTDRSKRRRAQSRAGGAAASQPDPVPRGGPGIGRPQRKKRRSSSNTLESPNTASSGGGDGREGFGGSGDRPATALYHAPLTALIAAGAGAAAGAADSASPASRPRRCAIDDLVASQPAGLVGEGMGGPADGCDQLRTHSSGRPSGGEGGRAGARMPRRKCGCAATGRGGGSGTVDGADGAAGAGGVAGADGAAGAGGAFPIAINAAPASCAALNCGGSSDKENYRPAPGTQEGFARFALYSKSRCRGGTPADGGGDCLEPGARDAGCAAGPAGCAAVPASCSMHCEKSCPAPTRAHIAAKMFALAARGAAPQSGRATAEGGGGRKSGGAGAPPRSAPAKRPAAAAARARRSLPAEWAAPAAAASLPCPRCAAAVLRGVPAAGELPVPPSPPRAAQEVTWKRHGQRHVAAVLPGGLRRRRKVPRDASAAGAGSAGSGRAGNGSGCGRGSGRGSGRGRGRGGSASRLSLALLRRALRGSGMRRPPSVPGAGSSAAGSAPAAPAAGSCSPGCAGSVPAGRTGGGESRVCASEAAPLAVSESSAAAAPKSVPPDAPPAASTDAPAAAPAPLGGAAVALAAAPPAASGAQSPVSAPAASAPEPDAKPGSKKPPAPPLAEKLQAWPAAKPSAVEPPASPPAPPPARAPAALAPPPPRPLSPSLPSGGRIPPPRLRKSLPAPLFGPKLSTAASARRQRRQSVAASAPGGPAAHFVYPEELLQQMVAQARALAAADYLGRFPPGSRISPASRRVILSYMADVGLNIRSPISRFTIHIAGCLFDRFIDAVSAPAAGGAAAPAARDAEAELEVVAAACLYLASKLEDSWNISLGDICKTFDDGSTAREGEVLKWELKISATFAFRFNAPTILDFLYKMINRLQSLCGPVSSEVRRLALIAADEALLNHRCSLGHPTHVPAAAALLIAVTEVHKKTHRTSNLPVEVRSMLGDDRRKLCAVTHALYQSLQMHPEYAAFCQGRPQPAGGAPPITAAAPAPALAPAATPLPVPPELPAAPAEAPPPPCVSVVD